LFHSYSDLPQNEFWGKDAAQENGKQGFHDFILHVHPKISLEIQFLHYDMNQGQEDPCRR